MPKPSTHDILTRVYTSLTPKGVDPSPPALGHLVLSLIDGKAYRFGKWLDGTALTVGDAAYRDYTNGIDTWEFNEEGETGTGLDTFGGIALGAGAQNNWVWFQQFGEHTAANVEGTTDIAIGDSLKGVAAQRYLVQDVAIGTTPSYHNYARALAAYATNSASATGDIAIMALGF